VDIIISGTSFIAAALILASWGLIVFQRRLPTSQAMASMISITLFATYFVAREIFHASASTILAAIAVELVLIVLVTTVISRLTPRPVIPIPTPEKNRDR
jgi:hypothetical protein